MILPHSFGVQDVLNDSQLSKLNDDGFVLASIDFKNPWLERLEKIFWATRDSLDNYSGWSFIGIFRKSPVYLSFLNQTPIAQIGHQLLGKNVDLYWDSVATKPAFEGKSFSWHQDSGLVATDPLEYYTFWIPFQRTTVENGCLWVKPKSHKLGLLPHVSVRPSMDVYPGKRIEDFDSTGEQPVEMDAGEVLIFHSLLAHRSGPNNSIANRSALAFGLHKRGYKEINLPNHIKPMPGLAIS